MLEHCGERGVRGAIIVSAGFREGGEAGAAWERAMLQVASRYGLRLLGPNSFGVIRTDNGFNASCGAALPKPGRLALVSQSSALCAATLDWARSRHVGFSTVISTGVGDDIDFGDMLDFLARDGATDRIMLYLEGIGDARRFMSALRAAARVKPVVVMKAGRSLEGRSASLPTRARWWEATMSSTRRCGAPACCASAISASCSVRQARSVPACGCAGAGWAS